VRAETGSRPSATRSEGCQSVDLVGAMDPDRDPGGALILLRGDTAARTLFLDEPSGHVAAGAHVVLVLDGGAGWPTARASRVKR
jgi:hypothetical protein